ncbi:MAG: DUF4091 domain-containing protein [Fusicatenibacter sp.]|nr:DUF4091 domain-containing protein [Lachnospiraceae bacterium]MDY2939152.1 DUF4091 domain-containing protein [Fusicatenibacter sp.]
MHLWTDSSLSTVWKYSTEPQEFQTGYQLHMVRNSFSSYQILLKDKTDFTIRSVKADGFDPDSGISLRCQFQETIDFRHDSYPDPLSNEPSIEVASGEIQSIWVTVYVDSDVLPGLYQGQIRIEAGEEEYVSDLEIKLYSPVLPSGKEAAFSTEYWMNTTNFWFRYPDPGQLDFLNYYYGCEKYSSTWWEINRSIAEHMKENRINVLFVRTHDLLLDGGTTLDENGTYHFCWDLFDKWVDFFDRYAEIKFLAGYHLVVQTEGKKIYLIDRVDEKPVISTSEIGSPKTENWLKQFLPALFNHLTEREDQHRWLQHIEDEPSESDSWRYAREYVRNYMPGIRCMDAIDNQQPMPSLQQEMDLWIPRVDVYEQNRDFYDYRLSQGDARWTYNCCEPHYQNYANKFLGWPLLHNRILPWGCFVNHFNGFLHWGYNFWDPKDPWFGLNPDAVIKGDGYIVYPDPKHSGIKNSIRMISTRDGAQDFELLSLLAKKDPSAAFCLARKVILRFNDFNWDTSHFEEIRMELLEALENSSV